jgi:hypothetical protein
MKVHPSSVSNTAASLVRRRCETSRV